ncbi:MAG: MBL fold metallo-hydrolase, partial [Actinomycetota bacterium]|nr:MBL fold metallo-hydrolase [Actinomycetota bacterium]
MCDSVRGSPPLQLSVPRPATGLAVDPIALDQVDEVQVTTLVDNVFDALLPGDERTRRVSFGASTTAAPQFEGSATPVGLVAEHGFAALV